MKLRKLRIHNIASIEDAEIDFESTPLSDSSVFLIAGKTGAGKSTILDAISLALYDDTPRLAGTNMQGGIKEREKNVQPWDTEQLLRRGCGEGYVSLSFTATDGTRYEASWSVARAHKKPTGAIQSRRRSLINEDTGETYSKLGEVKGKLLEVLGLDFTQFCRTTMLAQGEFSRFLNSEDKEKASILEKITGVDIYSRIGVKINALRNEKEREWQDARRAIEGVQMMSEEELEAMQGQLSTLQDAYGKKERDKKQDSMKAEWLRIDTELRKGLEEAAARLRDTQAVASTEEFKTQEKTLKDWNVSADARGRLRACEESRHRIEEEERKLSSLRDESLGTAADMLLIKENMLGVKERKGMIEEWLKGEKPRELTYEKSGDLRIYLDTLLQNRRTVTAETTKAEREEETIKEKLRPKFDSARKTSDEAERKVKGMKETLDGMIIRLEAMKLPELRKRGMELTKLIGRLGVIKERVAGYEDSKAKLKDKKDELKATEEGIASLERILGGLEEHLQAAREKADRTKILYESQKDTVDKFASMMRAKLKVGDKCPVCRQEIVAAFSPEKELEAMVKGYEDAWKKAEEERLKLEAEKVGREAEIKLKEKSRRDIKKEVESDEKALDAKRGELLMEIKEMGIETLDAATIERLDAIRLECRKEMDELSIRIKEGDKLEGETKDARKAFDANREEAAKAVEALRAVQEEIGACEKRRDESRNIVSMKRDEAAENESNISALVAGEWQTDWKTAPDVFEKELKEATSVYRKKLEEKDCLKVWLEKEENILKSIHEVLAGICSLMPEWSEDIKKALEGEGKKGKAPDPERVLNSALDLKAGVVQAKRNLGELRKNVDEMDEWLNQFTEDHEELGRDRLAELNALSSGDVESIMKEVEELRQKLTADRVLLDDMKDRLALHGKGKPELGEEDTIERLAERIAAGAEKLKELSEQEGALRQRLTLDEENRKKVGGLERELNERKEEFDRWERLNKYLGNPDGSKFRRVAQSYVLESLLNSANHYLSTLSGRYRLRANPGTFVISVEDAYLGGERRIASTLSGGETFLVSLALALALSDIGDVLGMDVLFIDEGFGTLSGEPLQNAINTLHALHSATGKHVGIISHVEELREKIPVQIRVDQASNHSASTVTVVPCEKH